MWYYREAASHHSPGSLSAPGTSSPPRSRTLKGCHTRRVCNPFRVGDWRRTGNPGCAARPWAKVYNAFGVAEPPSAATRPRAAHAARAAAAGSPHVTTRITRAAPRTQPQTQTRWPPRVHPFVRACARSGRQTDWSCQFRARTANSSMCRGQSCNVAGSKSAPFGQTSVCTSGSITT